MIEAAKKAMTPEQIEAYKKIGEYMYSNEAYRTMETGSRVRPSQEEDLILYATQALQSGLHPRELSTEELQALIRVYGPTWYKRFDYEKDDVPEPAVQLVQNPEEMKLVNILNRPQRRALERQKAKEEKRRK